MSFRSYTPKRGDLVHMNFSPSAGHEMADRHYALVISASAYNRLARMCIVCPITSRIRDWSFAVAVPSGLLPDKRGVGAVQSIIVVDGIRQIDYREREIAFINVAPKELVEEVLDRLLSLLDDE